MSPVDIKYSMRDLVCDVNYCALSFCYMYVKKKVYDQIVIKN